jgi:Meiosis protein SPO22/ZIP4 like
MWIRFSRVSSTVNRADKIALGNMIEFVHLNEDTFKRFPRFSMRLTCSIMNKIHTMDTDISSAKQCINCLNSLLRRLYPLDKVEWLEQALVTRVYMTGKYPETQNPEGIKDLKRLLDGLSPTSRC